MNPHRFTLLFFAKSCFSLILLLTTTAAYCQQVGDYRTVAGSTNWTTLSSWQRWDGSSWQTPTNLSPQGWPGQFANAGLVTITSGNNVILNTDVGLVSGVPTYLISKIEMYGKIEVNMNATRQINATEIEAFPPNGQFLFTSSQAALRIPPNSAIFFPVQNPAYKGFDDGGNCNNNVAIYIGGGSFGGTEVKYTACTGQGNVCVTFAEANAAGGTLRIVPNIDVSSSLGTGNTSCVPGFTGIINIFGVLPQSRIALSLGGANITYSQSFFAVLQDGVAPDLTPAGDGIIQLNVGVSTPTITDGLVKTYTATAGAVLTFDASVTKCTGFSASTSTSADFLVRPPVSLSIDNPSGVCLNEPGKFVVTNNTALATTLTYNIDGGPNQTLTVAGGVGQTTDLVIPTNVSGNFVYQFSGAQFSTAPACSVPLSVTRNFAVGNLGALAVNGDTKLPHDLTLSSIVTTTTGCRVIAEVTNAGTITQLNGRAYVGSPFEQATPSGRVAFIGRRVLLEPFGSPGGPATITLYATQEEFDAFNASAFNGLDLPFDENDAQGKANLRVYKYDATNFNATTGLPDPITAIPVTINPDDNNIVWNATLNRWEISFDVTGFSGFVISNERLTTLPLHLLTFKATLSGKRTALLTWNTKEERNVSHFEVEVSRDGQNFVQAGRLVAKNSAQGANYSLYAAMPGKLAYYRLRSVDIDGKFMLSPVKVLRTDAAIINSYPNPVSSQLTVDLSGYPAGSLRIMDMQGRILLSAATVDGINKVNTATLASGIYVLEVKVGNEIEQIKISKMQNR